MFKLDAATSLEKSSSFASAVTGRLLAVSLVLPVEKSQREKCSNTLTHQHRCSYVDFAAVTRSRHPDDYRGRGPSRVEAEL
jgi:hypothetical protein